MRCLIPFLIPNLSSVRECQSAFHNSPHLDFRHNPALLSRDRSASLSGWLSLESPWEYTSGCVCEYISRKRWCHGGSQTKHGKKTLHLQHRLSACVYSRHSQWPLLPRVSPYGIVIRLLSPSLLIGLQKSHGTSEPQIFLPLKSLFVILNLYVTHIWLVSFWKSTVA